MYSGNFKKIGLALFLILGFCGCLEMDPPKHSNGNLRLASDWNDGYEFLWSGGWVDSSNATSTGMFSMWSAINGGLGQLDNDTTELAPNDGSQVRAVAVSEDTGIVYAVFGWDAGNVILSDSELRAYIYNQSDLIQIGDINLTYGVNDMLVNDFNEDGFDDIVLVTTVTAPIPSSGLATLTFIDDEGYEFYEADEEEATGCFRIDSGFFVPPIEPPYLDQVACSAKDLTGLTNDSSIQIYDIDGSLNIIFNDEADVPNIPAGATYLTQITDIVSYDTDLDMLDDVIYAGYQCEGDCTGVNYSDRCYGFIGIAKYEDNGEGYDWSIHQDLHRQRIDEYNFTWFGGVNVIELEPEDPVPEVVVSGTTGWGFFGQHSFIENYLEDDYFPFFKTYALNLATGKFLPNEGNYSVVKKTENAEQIAYDLLFFDADNDSYTEALAGVGDETNFTFVFSELGSAVVPDVDHTYLEDNKHVDFDLRPYNTISYTFKIENPNNYSENYYVLLDRGYYENLTYALSDEYTTSVMENGDYTITITIDETVYTEPGTYPLSISVVPILSGAPYLNRTDEIHVYRSSPTDVNLDFGDISAVYYFALLVFVVNALVLFKNRLPKNIKL